MKREWVETNLSKMYLIRKTKLKKLYFLFVSPSEKSLYSFGIKAAVTTYRCGALPI